MTVRISTKAAWLLLTFTLPGNRASKRVEVWRKLQRYGTVPLGNSGYLLPNSPSNEERFEWLATEIRKYEGDASVVHVASVDNLSTAQLIGRFAEARTKEYQGIISEIERFTALPLQGRDASRLARLKSRFQEIAAVDFFSSPLQKRVGELLTNAEAKQDAHAPAHATKIQTRDFQKRLWVTRRRPGVDRCASAWLIRRYIDHRARFGFAQEEQVPAGAVAFDMFRSGGFGHRGSDCTFETLQKDFRIQNPKVKVVGEIIHDADLSDKKYGRNEGLGLDEVLKGWAKQGIPDADLLERGIQMMEGLYHSLK